MSDALASAALIFVSGLIFGACLSYRWQRRTVAKIGRENITDVDHAFIPATDLGDNKLVLVVRNDLKMGKGKVAAQCSHAAVSAHESSRKNNPKTFSDWKNSGQPKIVVKVDSEKEMMDLALKARNCNLLVSIVQDAGRTQVASGTKTVLAIGPGQNQAIDQLTEGALLFLLDMV